MQPTYIPWIGYFEMIAASDIFIFLDDVQFSKKSWQQRNRVKGANGEFWLTIPVVQKNGPFQKINEIFINNSMNWRQKHLKSIEMTYQKSQYFKQYISAVKEIYSEEWTYLADFNMASIHMLMEQIGISTPTIRSSAMAVAAKGNEKIVELCKYVEADELYDAAGAEKFIDNDLFNRSGIQVAFQNYMHPEYSQLHGAFMPYMSAIDLLFNHGANSLHVIRSGALPPTYGENI